MTLIWTRVDQKLIHGQVSVAWVPYLRVNAIVVADPDTVDDPWAQKVMMMGLPPEVQLTSFAPPGRLAGLLGGREMELHRVLVLFKDLEGVLEATEAGLRLDSLNLGNQACQPPEQSIRLTETFYACRRDLEGLARLQRGGLEVVLQAVPSDKVVRWQPRRE